MGRTHGLNPHHPAVWSTPERPTPRFSDPLLCSSPWRLLIRRRPATAQPPPCYCSDPAPVLLHRCRCPPIQRPPPLFFPMVTRVVWPPALPRRCRPRAAAACWTDTSRSRARAPPRAGRPRRCVRLHSKSSREVAGTGAGASSWEPAGRWHGLPRLRGDKGELVDLKNLHARRVREAHRRRQRQERRAACDFNNPRAEPAGSVWILPCGVGRCGLEIDAVRGGVD
jgi:hypothetical protein